MFWILLICLLVFLPIQGGPRAHQPGKTRSAPPSTYQAPAPGRLHVQVGRRHLDLAEHFETGPQGVREFGQAQHLHLLSQRLQQTAKHLWEVLGLHLWVKFLWNRRGFNSCVINSKRHLGKRKCFLSISLFHVCFQVGKQNSISSWSKYTHGHYFLSSGFPLSSRKWLPRSCLY